jgi:phage tail-like protein
MAISWMMKHLFKLSALLCVLATGMDATSPPQMRPTRPPDATAPRELRGSAFAVEADGKKMGTFRRISTGSAPGTERRTRQSRNIKKNPPPMVLSGGDAASMQAFEIWRKKAADSKFDSERHTVIILSKDAFGNTVQRYKLTHAWPIRLTTAGESSGKDSAATTTVELAFEKMEIVH